MCSIGLLLILQFLIKVHELSWPLNLHFSLPGTLTIPSSSLQHPIYPGDTYISSVLSLDSVLQVATMHLLL